MLVLIKIYQLFNWFCWLNILCLKHRSFSAVYGQIRITHFCTNFYPVSRIQLRRISASANSADIAAPRGTPIIASASGTVVTATYHNSVFSYGNYVILDHGDGYRTLYAHMSAFAVKQGDVVQQGQIIGYVGDTGYSFGCHCHFEMFGPGGRFSAQLLFPTL